MIKSLAVRLLEKSFYLMSKTKSLFVKRREKNIVNPKFLVCRLDHIGDVIMTTPAFRAIKEQYPNSRVIALTNAPSASLIKSNPFIDESIIFNWPWPYDKRSNKWTKEHFRACIKVVRQLRKSRIDVFLEFRGDPRFFLLFGVFAKIPYRISTLRKGGKSLLTDSVPFVQDEHQIDIVAKILGQANIKVSKKRPEIFLEEADRASLNKVFDQMLFPANQPYVVVSPFSAHGIREWPFANWQAIAQYLQANHQLATIIVGTKDDYAIADSIVGDSKGIIFNFCGTTTLRNVAALMEKATIVVGVDTGTQHIASCFDVPVLTIFGPAKPQETRPITPFGVYIDNNSCVCDRDKRTSCEHLQNGHAQCLVETSVKQVCKELENMLRK